MDLKTLYQFVENKNDLVSKVLDYLLHERGCTLSEIAAKNQNAIEELIETGVHIIKMFKEYNPSTEYDLKKYYPELFAKLNKVRTQRMYDAVLKNIVKGKKEGLYRLDMNDIIIAKIQTSRFMHLNIGDIFSPEELSNPQNVLELFIYHIRGIANEKGLKVLDEILKDIDINKYLQ